MKLPKLKRKLAHWPTKPLCPVCKKKKVFEPHSFVLLSSFSLLSNRRKKRTFSVDHLDTSVELMYHGAHDTGVGTRRNIMAQSKIASDVYGGQVELYFCSTKCIRKFFNAWVDDLEKDMKIKTKKHNQSLQLAARPRRAAVVKRSR